MLSQNQILFGNQKLQEVAISWDVPILKAAKILASKEIDEFWKWLNADEFLNYKLNTEEEKKKFAKNCKIQDTFEEEKKQYEIDSKTHEKPWELWQYAVKNRDVLNWCDLSYAPIWKDHLVYRRKITSFVPEYYSGLNWRDAEHLIGKIVECTDNPDSWYIGKLEILFKVNKNFCVNIDKRSCWQTYIRTCEETYQQQVINICGVKLPKPETVAPALGTKYWLTPACNERVWYGYHYNISALKEGRVHLTEERAKAWADWWNKEVIDKIKG